MTSVSSKGVFEYLGWSVPWRLSADGAVTDLSELFWMFAQAQRGKLCSQNYGRDFYELRADSSSDFELRFEEIGSGIALFMTEGRFGFSNVLAYTEYGLQYLNGRQVIVDVSDEHFRISANPEFPVFGVMFFGSGNSAQVPEGKERELCKVGTPDACLFATFGADGFQCDKFSGSTARMLLDRKLTGTIRAQRIGDCALIGRVGT